MITRVPGFSLGHASDFKGVTGCTVILCPPGMGRGAAGGVMEYLEEKGRGFDVAITRVPIVPAAVIFDLSIGNCRARPDKAMGYTACQAARPEPQGDGRL